VPAGQTIAWGEVILTDVPDMATALKARVGPRDATVRTASAWRWEFALFARSKGSGTLRGSARLVVCTDATCVPCSVPLAEAIVVGPDSRPDSPDGGH
jgi:hypothetical protein